MQKFIWSEYFETQTLSNTVWPETHYVVHKLGLELTEITCSFSHENTSVKQIFIKDLVQRLLERFNFQRVLF